MAAVIVSLTLVAAAFGIVIRSAREIITPHHAPEPFTLAVLVLVVVTKETLFRFGLRWGRTLTARRQRGDAWHHRSDALTSAAAFVGISVALIGGAVYESADDWAALFASSIILINAYRILRPAIDEVMDTAPPSHIEEEVRGSARLTEGVSSLE